MERERDVLDWLPHLLARQEFDDEDVCRFIAVLLIEFGFSTDALPPSLQAILSWFLVQAGVELGEQKSESRAKILAHLKKAPLNPKLVSEFNIRLRSAVAIPNNESIAEAFARFTGQGPRNFEALLAKSKKAGYGVGR